MNFVIYSYNFFPQADAESYCATRFASALARAGHNVTVVTMDWPMQVSQESYDALVAKELKIVKVPFSNKKNSPLKAVLWYGHKSQMAVDVPASVKAVKAELESLDKPILITRAHPVACCMVGLKTRRYAYKWVAHFSDPMPGFGYADTIGHRILRKQEYNIVKNSFIKSDCISVTCKHVCRYFKDVYGKYFDESKVCVNTHIGDYRLGGPRTIDTSGDKPIILHSGTIYEKRGGKMLLDLSRIFTQENIDVQLVQVGHVDVSIINQMKTSKNIEVFNTVSLEKSLELCSRANAYIIPDFELSTPYSPFILSKFVYTIMEPQPIIVYSKRESAMHDYAMLYPEAGIFWAEYGNFDSLKRAIDSALKCKIKDIDRKAIRKCFSEQTIVNNFISTLQNLLK